MLTQILGRIRVADGTTVEQIQNQVETALMAETLLQGGQSLHHLPAGTYRRPRSARQAAIPDELLRGQEPRHRLEIRRQRQRREQEHRHAHRRATQAELHPSQPPPADRPVEGDVRQRSLRPLPRTAQPPFHLQERRDVAGQLLRLDHDVSVAAERHDLDRRQLDAADQSQILLRRLRQHGLHRLVDALGRLRHPPNS